MGYVLSYFEPLLANSASSVGRIVRYAPSFTNEMSLRRDSKSAKANL